jgi:hypothetical protein
MNVTTKSIMFLSLPLQRAYIFVIIFPMTPSMGKHSKEANTEEDGKTFEGGRDISICTFFFFFCNLIQQLASVRCSETVPNPSFLSELLMNMNEIKSFL